MLTDKSCHVVTGKDNAKLVNVCYLVFALTFAILFVIEV